MMAPSPIVTGATRAEFGADEGVGADLGARLQ